jgi:lipoate-protein ligase A
MSLLARHGVIDEVNIKHSDGAAVDALDASIFQRVFIWEIDDWAESLTQAGLGGTLSKEAGAWLNGIFGTEYTKM